MTRRPTLRRPPRPATLAVVLGAGLASLLWAYWPTLGDAAQSWSQDPQYSHGYLVPAFVLLLLWLRRDRLATDALRPSWWGAPLLAAGITLRLVGAHYG